MKVKLHAFFIVLLFSINSWAFSQDTQVKLKKDSININPLSFQKRIGLEFFILPAYVYNSFSLGISYKNHIRWEQCLLVSSSNIVYPQNFNLQLNYNVNYFLKNNEQFIPIWIRVNNTRRDVNYELGYHPHLLEYSIGSGFGRTIHITQKFFFRTELGIGISLNLTNGKGNVFPYSFKPNEYTIDEKYPNQNPPLTPTFKLKFTFYKEVWHGPKKT